VASQIDLGRDVFVGPNAWLNITTKQARLKLGAGTVVGASFTVSCGELVEVGEGCLFSDRVTLLDQLHGWEEWVRPALAEGREPRFTWAMTPPRPVSIGAGTWLGIGVAVLPGVSIGVGCAVGANAVVTSDIPDYSAAAGVPARVLRSLVDDRD
jgi:acetyltransferase-like isoleucine patch superfamily enzyme